MVISGAEFFFPIYLVLKYMLTSRLEFQTWYSTFLGWIFNFIVGYMTTWSRGSHRLVSEQDFKNQVIFFIFLLLILNLLDFVVFNLIFNYFISRTRSLRFYKKVFQIALIFLSRLATLDLFVCFYFFFSWRKQPNHKFKLEVEFLFFRFALKVIGWGQCVLNFQSRIIF
jgi:hypothetical protein